MADTTESPDSATRQRDNAPPGGRIALGLNYSGTLYRGWQSQPGGNTVQDVLEAALQRFTTHPVKVTCAGRTDAGVHALNQVVHFDAPVVRELASWVRGVNAHLPPDIAVQWSRAVSNDFHARFLAQGRRYRYLLLESPVRTAIEHSRCGWVFRPLDQARMQAAASILIGEHDFSAFRSAMCQARSPVKTLRDIRIQRHGAYWRFDFDGSAFLHHMVRNIMGCLIAVGSGTREVVWMQEVLDSRCREFAAPTFAADGLYFEGPYYDPVWQIPDRTPAQDWLL